VPGWDTRSRRASEPALTPEELHLVRWGLGGLLALVSVWSAFLLELSGAVLPLCLTVPVLATLARPALAARIPAWGWRLAFPGLILFVAADMVLNGEPLAALLRLNLLLIAVRACGPRRPREDLQLVVLCLFLVVIAGVLSAALGFALHILIFTALALAYLLAITLSETSEPEAAGSELWARIPWPRLLRRLRRAVDWRVVAACGGLYLLVVAVASALFIAMPRFHIENSLSFLQLKNKRSLSGFSDTVKLGDVTDIAQDRSIALRAELTDTTRVPSLPYWRMVALDEYRDGGFQASRGQLRHDRRLPEARDIAGTRTEAGGPVWTFYYEAGVSRYLPLPGEFAQLRLREARALVENRHAATLALREEPQTMFAYRVDGLDFGGERAEPELARELRSAPGASAGADDYPHTLLAVPAGERNAAALDAILGEVTGGERQTAAEFSKRAVAWLAQHHRYSTRSSVPAGAEDVLVRWLGSAAPGHCELFAGGFALLARRAGFPTRLVTGFTGGNWNAFEGYFMVRNSDAHAWCELYDERGCWVRVDPTPGAGDAITLAAAATSGAGGIRVERGWEARLDALRMLWYRRIVNFDRGSQEAVVDLLKRTTRESGRKLLAKLDRWGLTLRDWLLRPWDFGRMASWCGMAALGAALGWAAWRWRYLWWFRWTRRGRRADPVRREAGRWLRRFAQVESALPGEAASVIEALERLRYGSPVGRRRPLAVFKRAKRAWRACR